MIIAVAGLLAAISATNPAGTAPRTEGRASASSALTRVVVDVWQPSDTVAIIPPDSLPRALLTDSNFVEIPSFGGLRAAKNLVWVAFRASSTLQLRQAAVALVGGEVVGGSRFVPSGDGEYIIRVRSDAQAKYVLAAMRTLAELPAVEYAVPVSGYNMRAQNSSPSLVKNRPEDDVSVDGVPAVSPDSIPSALLVSLPTITDGANRVLRTQMVVVRFQAGVSVAARAKVVSAIGGRVVGGIRWYYGEGSYYIHVPTATTEASLFKLEDVLQQMPGVEEARVLVFSLEPSESRERSQGSFTR